MSDPNEQRVSFTVKELFLDLKEGLKRIEEKIEHTASEADLQVIATRVTSLETDKASKDAVDRYKKWQTGIAVAIGLDVGANVARLLGLIK